MAAQLGFAVGLVVLVPLGDRIDRRRLILLQMTALAVSLVAAALAPNAWALVVISALVGITSSVAQQIVPFAAELAEPSRRGATIGTVMSGLLCGMLLGRVVAGVVADHYGWRAMYWLSVLLVIATLSRCGRRRKYPICRNGTYRPAPCRMRAKTNKDHTSLDRTNSEKIAVVSTTF